MNELLRFGVSLTVSALTVGASACNGDVPHDLAELRKYETPLRSDEQLSAHLDFACRTAKLRRSPVLVELGAEWCTDCRHLEELEKETPLRDELARWQVVKVNLGDGLHPDLTEAFEVRAIARWIALSPGDCQRPIWQWSKLGDRVVEPKTGKGASSVELVEWLVTTRGVDL